MSSGCSTFVIISNKNALIYNDRWQSHEPLRSISWHHEGKHFVSSHIDGSLCTWPLRATAKPQTHIYPHAKTMKDGKLETCKPIHKVEMKTTRNRYVMVVIVGKLLK